MHSEKGCTVTSTYGPFRKKKRLGRKADMIAD